MKLALQVAFTVVLEMLLAVSEVSAMSANMKYVDETQALIAAFEKDSNPDTLLAALHTLNNVVPAIEVTAAARRHVRREALGTWLVLFDTVTQRIDHKFNPNDLPELTVQPPPTAGGIVYPPGADPALIDDPAARIKYEKEIAESRRKAEAYRLQTSLRKADGRIRKQLVAFVSASYEQTEDDQKDLVNTIEAAAPGRDVISYLRGFVGQLRLP